MIARLVPRVLGSASFMWAVLFSSAAATADLMELLSGAKLEGKVTKIDKAAKEVTFETTLGGRPCARARLGNRQMAMEILNQRLLRIGMIKLLADMGETDKALQVAATWVKVGGEPHPAYLAAGDACRLAGRFKEAIACYQKVLSTPPMTKREKAAENYKNRARANLDAVKLFELCDVRKVPDGVYTASSIAYAGELVVEVTVKSGRLEAVQVKRHEEKQFYSALTDTPRQIIEKQDVKGVDAVSGATITSEAILNATAKALAKASN